MKQVQQTAELLKEAAINRRLTHPNCVRRMKRFFHCPHVNLDYGVWFHDGIPHMVLEVILLTLLYIIFSSWTSAMCVLFL